MLTTDVHQIEKQGMWWKRSDQLRCYDVIFIWLDDLARGVLGKQLPSIEVSDGHLEPTQSLNQADTLDHVKVAAFTAEILILI